MCSALALALAWALGSVSLWQPKISAWCLERLRTPQLGLAHGLDLFAVRLQRPWPHLVAFDVEPPPLPYRLGRIALPEQEAVLWLMQRRYESAPTEKT